MKIIYSMTRFKLVSYGFILKWDRQNKWVLESQSVERMDVSTDPHKREKGGRDPTFPVLHAEWQRYFVRHPTLLKFLLRSSIIFRKELNMRYILHLNRYSKILLLVDNSFSLVYCLSIMHFAIKYIC